MKLLRGTNKAQPTNKKKQRKGLNVRLTNYNTLIASTETRLCRKQVITGR